MLPKCRSQDCLSAAGIAGPSVLITVDCMVCIMARAHFHGEFVKVDLTGKVWHIIRGQANEGVGEVGLAAVVVAL
jgi:hypothetical protein